MYVPLAVTLSQNHSRLTEFASDPNTSSHAKPSRQIRTFDPQDVFELLNFRDQELFLDHLPEIRKQNDFEVSEESEPKKRTMAVLKLTEGLWTD
jgi:predicted acetyltransferase